MRPLLIPESITRLNKDKEVLEKEISRIKENFSNLNTGEPLISVIIPAYNEEENLLKTLYSLSLSTTSHAVEVIVVNNNSKDLTGQYALNSGVICIDEKKQGITNARNAGLAVAKGTYILNADADTIYPASWIDDMVAPLIADESVCLTYGKFSFIPIGETSRLVYFFYEYFADLNRKIIQLYKEEALNVYGFNSACRRVQILAVNGFDHPQGNNEDGWLAFKLRGKGFGKLYWVTLDRSIVWTTDRRILLDGGFFVATLDRLHKYLRPSHYKKKK
ncbi:glycosyltransferase family 2 protein [Pedobacter sp. AW31-3R]|uniref:glycosyltransferase family 2 protein n=1 Tax=Pedobacter sp. AW31-3R TaxID=3445781 RepID=UPI003F9F77B9